MTVKEKRERIIEICSTVSGEDCHTDVCPIVDSCEKYHIFLPKHATNSEIEAVYAHAVRLGTIKEENNP